ncbi:alpha/beta-hydrolase, partial [Aureobasidium melanogenum]
LLFAFPHLTNVHNVLSNDAKEVATQVTVATVLITPTERITIHSEYEDNDALKDSSQTGLTLINGLSLCALRFVTALSLSPSSLSSPSHFPSARSNNLSSKPNGSNPSSLFFFCAHSVSPLKNTTTPPLPDTLAVILNNGAPVAGRGLAVAVREVQWRKQSWQFVHISSFILQSQSIALGSRISTTCTRRLFLQRKLLGSCFQCSRPGTNVETSQVSNTRRNFLFASTSRPVALSASDNFGTISVTTVIREEGSSKHHISDFLNIRDVQSFDCLNHLLHLLDIVVGLVDVHLQASSSSLSRFAILSASVSAGTTFDVMSPAVLLSVTPIQAPQHAHPQHSFFFPFLIPPFPRSPLLFTRILVFLSLGFCFSSLLSFILFRLFFYSADTCTLWSQFDFDGVDNALALLSQSLTLLFGALAAVVVGAEFAFALEACALHLVAREDRPCQDSAILMERLALKGDSVAALVKSSSKLGSCRPSHAISRSNQHVSSHINVQVIVGRREQSRKIIHLGPSFLPEAVPLVGLGVAVAVNTPVSATVLVPLLPLCNSTARRAVLFRVRIPYACCHNALALFHVTDLLRRASVLHCSDPTSRCWLLGQWRVCISAIDDTSEDGKGSLRLIEWHHVSRVVDSAEREIAKLAHSTSDITRVNDDIRIACTVPAREQKKRPRHLSSCTSKETYNVVSIAIHQRNTHSRTEEVGNIFQIGIRWIWRGSLNSNIVNAEITLTEWEHQAITVGRFDWRLSDKCKSSDVSLISKVDNWQRQETLEEMPCSSGRDIGGIACGHWVARAEKNDDHVDIAEPHIRAILSKHADQTTASRTSIDPDSQRSRLGILSCLSGVLYAMVIFSLMGDLRMFEYWTGGGNCASTSNGAARREATTACCMFS